MAWVSGRYQHSIRRNGRVTTETFHGSDAALFAASFRLWAEDRAEAREQARAEAEEERRIYLAEKERGEVLRLLVATCLEGFGYHRHGRHRWRRGRRMGEIQTVQARGDLRAIRAELRALMVAIDKARDPAAVERLCRLARAHPELAAREIGMDMAEITRRRVAGLFKDRRAKVLAAQEVMIGTLAGENPSPELLLAAQHAAFDQVEVWLLNFAAASESNLFNDSPMTIKRRTAAHRRSLLSLKALATIKALERPRHVISNTQINVNADRQST